MKSVNTPKNKLYDIEYIITRRTERSRNFYLIKWEGYSIKDCSWEPVSHLSNIKDMVKEFDDNFPYSINQKALKEFYIELHKYEHKKILQKKRLLKKIKKERKSNKIIISLSNDSNSDSTTSSSKDSDNNSNNKESLCITINSIIKINENKENNNRQDKEISITLDKESNEDSDINNLGKLKKPILIW